MNKIYHLSSCSTCVRIIKELEVDDSFELQNLKEKNISAKALDELAKVAGSYEALLNKRAMKYRSMGIKDQNLADKAYRRLILDEYTFLKRPIVIIEGEAFIGNAKKVVAAAKEKLAK